MLASREKAETSNRQDKDAKWERVLWVQRQEVRKKVHTYFETMIL